MQVKIGIIANVGLCGFFKGKEIAVNTAYGQPSDKILISEGAGKKIAFLARHGQQSQYPPHKINYRANIFALKKLGAKRIFGFYSVGSLKRTIKPGQFLVPHDFIGFDTISFYDKEARHITPQISQELREILTSVFTKLKLKCHRQGVYFETKGPRLETKAEINMIKNFADVVGMTMQKEATLSMEAGLKYVALCSIDNFAHGIAEKPPSQKEIAESKKKNIRLFAKIIKEI